MKHVQLNQCEIDATAILVDESQDCDACQIDWLVKQNGPGKNPKQIFFVGDAAQTIYSFRGAKSKNLAEIPNAIDVKLTTSFRFGKEIAAVANTVLFAKDNCPQKNTWVSYRVSGSEGKPGVLFDEHGSALNIYPRTILAFTNLECFNAALPILMANPNVKIALNGEGDNSGKGKWKGIIADIQKVKDLFDGKVSQLDFEEFREVENLTFNQFEDEVKSQFPKYSTHVELVKRNPENLDQLIETWSSKVMDNDYCSKEADVILSTIHAAKGMEWDTVQVVARLKDLDVEQKPSPHSGFQRAHHIEEAPLQFKFPAWGDDLHLMYVAVTRAKKVLYLPENLVEFFKKIQKPDLLGSETDSESFEKYIVKPWKDCMQTTCDDLVVGTMGSLLKNDNDSTTLSIISPQVEAIVEFSI